MRETDSSDILWTSDDVEESERRVTERISTTHADIVQLLKDLEQAYLLAFMKAQKGGASNYVSDIFFAKSFQTFRCAARLCTSGYYAQAGGLCRFLLEEALLIDYCRRFPVKAQEFLKGPNWRKLQQLFGQLQEALIEKADDATEVILDQLECEIRYQRTPMASEVLRRLKKLVRSRKLQYAKGSLDEIQSELDKDRIPSTQELISTLGLSPPLKASLGRRYEVLCHFVHSRRDPTIRSVIVAPHLHALAVGPKYDIEAFMVVAEYIIVAGHVALCMWTPAVPALLGDSTWLSHLKELGDRITELQLSAQELALIPNNRDLLNAYLTHIDLLK